MFKRHGQQISQHHPKRTWLLRDTTCIVPPCTGTEINRENPEENKYFTGPKDHERLFKLKPALNNKYEQLSVVNFLVKIIYIIVGHVR